MDNSGVFITLEGIEGVGKSTAVATVADTMRGLGRDVVVTREPGGTPLGEKIRALLLAPESKAMCTTTELLLMFAARAQHLAQVIEPALDAGQCVVCDRFTDATYAYQGGGRGLDLERIRLLEEWVHGDLQPDLTLYLDVPADVAFQRLTDRALDRIEQEEAEFFARVRDAYLQRAAAEPRIEIIDASVSLQAVGAAVEQTIREFLERGV